MKAKLIRFIKLLLILLLILGVAVIVLLNSSWAQTKLAKSITTAMSNDLGVTMTVQEVNIDLYKTVNLRQVYVEDQRGDTLALIGNLEGTIEKFSTGDKVIHFDELVLSDVIFYLKKEEGSDDQNIDFLVDYFKKPKDAKKSKWDVDCHSLILENAAFSNHDYNQEPKLDRVDVKHLGLCG